MVVRLCRWILQLLIALDQLACVWLAGWLYVWFGIGGVPMADETISSRVGRASMRGQRWAKHCEAIINGIFRALAGQRGHCRASIEWDETASRRPGADS